MKFASLKCFKVTARKASTVLKTLVPLPGSALDPRGIIEPQAVPRPFAEFRPLPPTQNPGSAPAPPMIVNTSTFTIKIGTSTIFHRYRELFGWGVLYIS